MRVSFSVDGIDDVVAESGDVVKASSFVPSVPLREAYIAAGGVQNSGPVAVDIVFRCKVPSTVSRKYAAACASGSISPTIRPHIDEIARRVLNELRGAAFTDRRQVVSLRVSKEWGARYGVTVVVEPLAKAGANA